MTWTGGVWRGPSIAEVAAAARVGTATVDRVFNGRTGVRPDTRRRVLEAYAALNRQAVRDEAQAPLRIAFITEAGSSFNNALGAAVAAHADPAVVCSFHAVSASDVKPIGFGQTIERFAQSSQGLVVVARENLTINRAIRSAVARGVPVVCLTTDLPNSNRTCYVGSDQITAGAQAALLMGRMLRGQAGEIVLVISSRYRSQEERERGFRRVLRSDFPGLRVVERVNSNDELEFSYSSVAKYVAERGPPLGVYNVSGGNEGIARALREARLRDRVVFIGHELDHASRTLLENDDMHFAIGHDFGREIALSVSLIVAATQNQPVQPIYRTSVLIYTKFNCSDR